MSPIQERRKVQFPISELPLHPHLKLTNDPFPRLLSTRVVEDDGSEYFGPFLNRSAARILIDHLNTTFKLRTCTIPIDGSFPVPCTQYYSRRCVGPCVESLCERDEYLGIVRLARLFLQNERREFELSVLALIDAASERLEFERAAFFRDILTKCRDFWADPRTQVWLDDAVDTFVFDREADVVTVFIITTRRARTLGSWTCEFQIFEETDPREFAADVIWQFYPVGGPREIRIPFDFPGRHEMARRLSTRFGRGFKIIVEGQVPERVTALKALARTKLNLDLENLKPNISPERIAAQLAKKFDLAAPPIRIEAFDAAHISGTYSTAGMAVWQNGRLRSEDYRQHLSEETAEISTLRKFIAERFRNEADELPGLVMIDGGKAHVNAAVSEIEALGLGVPVVGAVKPPGRHGDVSHFLTADGRRIEFDPSSASMRVLKLLRDESHDLANGAHRQSRDMAHFYEPAALLPSLNEHERQQLLARFGSLRKIAAADSKKIADVIGPERAVRAAADIESGRGSETKALPLIVPIRYDDPNGLAGDLRPIHRRNQRQAAS